MNSLTLAIYSLLCLIFIASLGLISCIKRPLSAVDFNESKHVSNESVARKVTILLDSIVLDFTGLFIRTVNKQYKNNYK